MVCGIRDVLMVCIAIVEAATTANALAHGVSGGGFEEREWQVLECQGCCSLLNKIGRV